MHAAQPQINQMSTAETNQVISKKTNCIDETMMTNNSRGNYKHIMQFTNINALMGFRAPLVKFK